MQAQSAWAKATSGPNCRASHDSKDLPACNLWIDFYMHRLTPERTRAERFWSRDSKQMRLLLRLWESESLRRRLPHWLWSFCLIEAPCAGWFTRPASFAPFLVHIAELSGVAHCENGFRASTSKPTTDHRFTECAVSTASKENVTGMSFPDGVNERPWTPTTAGISFRTWN